MRRQLVVAFVFAATVAVATEQSQPPAATPPVGGDTKQEQARPESAQPDPVGASNQPETKINVFGGTRGGEPNNQGDDESSPNGWTALFTGLLVVVGGMQVWALVRQHGIMDKQATIALAQKRVSDRQLEQMSAGLEVARMNAEAARKSADTQALQLRLVHKPCIEIRALHLERLASPDEPDEWILALWIWNAGSTPVRFLQIQADFTIAAGSQWNWAKTIEQTKGPGRGLRVPLTFDDWHPEEGKAQCVIFVNLRIELDHPIDGPVWQVFHQAVHCHEGKRPRIFEAKDREGWPEQKDPHKDQP